MCSKIVSKPDVEISIHCKIFNLFIPGNSVQDINIEVGEDSYELELKSIVDFCSVHSNSKSFSRESHFQNASNTQHIQHFGFLVSWEQERNADAFLQ